MGFVKHSWWIIGIITLIILSLYSWVFFQPCEDDALGMSVIPLYPILIVGTIIYNIFNPEVIKGCAELDSVIITSLVIGILFWTGVSMLIARMAARYKKH